jgi:hypothetical protein
MYSCRVIPSADSADHTVQDIVFIVHPSLSKRSKVAVIANTNTWNAYNIEGDYSYYAKDYTVWGGYPERGTGASILSFERPNPLANPRPKNPQDRKDWLEIWGGAELWFLQWLADQAVAFDLYSDQDFHNLGAYFSDYKMIILQCHPEYWTETMYKNLVAYLNSGGSLLYLGGNGIYERVEYDSTGSKMVGRPLSPSTTTTAYRWFMRNQLPELSILGVSFDEQNTSSKDDPTINRTSGYDIQPEQRGHWVFEGIGPGNLIGNNWESGPQQGCNGGACGFEMDKAYACYGNRPPTNCVTLAIGRVNGDGAHMTYYDHSGGGFVFSAGSVTYTGSLIRDPDLKIMFFNKLRRAGAI